MNSPIQGVELARQYSNRLLAGWPEFDSWKCKIFLISAASRSTLGPTQPPIQGVLGALTPGVKQ
jgi:hypothetical protein